MTADPWAAAAELFDQAIELPETEREAFLVDRCGDDRTLLERVRAMLDADARAVPLLDDDPRGLASLLELSGSERLVGRRIGPYTIRSQLGRGGMGVVWLAERADVGKRVALKLVAGGLGAPEVVARFHQERRLLAQLDHPNIARLVDAGIEPDGTPWLAMDYVDGAALDRHCDERTLSIEDRLLLFEEICAAVSYAHRHLIVHRDLKPANILVDGEGHPRLLDFGIAKLLDPELAGPGLTRSGLRLMTPQYASPEQLLGKPISTASDVYQLGLLLYQLLTGRTPLHPTPDGQDAATRVRVGKPSRVVSAPPEPPDRSGRTGDVLAAARGMTVEGLQRSLAGDLDTIVLEATAPEPERRYASVELLAEDVRRHREGLPIRARPATLWYRFRKLVSRHRAWSVAVAMAAVGLVAFLVVLDRQAKRVDRQRIQAEQALGLLVDLFTSADPLEVGSDTVTVAQVLDRGVERLRGDRTLEPAVRGRLLAVVATVYRNLARRRDAVELMAEAYDVLRVTAEPTDSLRLVVASQLAVLRRDSARSVPLQAEALAAARRLAPERRLELAAVLQSSGTLHQQLGLNDRARPFYQEAIAVFRSVPDSVPTAIGETLSDLAFLEESAGDMESAVRLWREALARREVRFGADHVELADAKLTLARGLLRIGEIDEAERLIQEANEAQRSLAPPHHRLANGLFLKAGLASARRRWAEAESLQRAGVAMLGAVVGDSSSVLARELGNLGVMVQSNGRLEEAERIYRDALGRYRLGMGARHSATAVTATNLAYNRFLQGRLAAAESLYRVSVPVLDSAWGGAPRIAGVLFDYGLVLARRDKCQEAVPLFRRHVALLGPGPEPHVSNGLGAFYVQGRCLARLDRREEAEPLFRQAHQWLVDRWGEDHPWVHNSARTLHEFYLEWGKPDSAARFPPPGGAAH